MMHSSFSEHFVAERLGHRARATDQRRRAANIQTVGAVSDARQRPATRRVFTRRRAIANPTAAAASP